LTDYVLILIKYRSKDVLYILEIGIANETKIWTKKQKSNMGAAAKKELAIENRQLPYLPCNHS
jgi:hypothetical protein